MCSLKLLKLISLCGYQVILVANHQGLTPNNENMLYPGVSQEAHNIILIGKKIQLSFTPTIWDHVECDSAQSLIYRECVSAHTVAVSMLWPLIEASCRSRSTCPLWGSAPKLINKINRQIMMISMFHFCVLSACPFNPTHAFNTVSRRSITG